jgi:hypothetical protein
VTLCEKIRQAKTGKEIASIIEVDPHFEGWRDSGSSHRIAKFKGGCSVPVPVHGNRDIPNRYEDEHHAHFKSCRFMYALSD